MGDELIGVLNQWINFRKDFQAQSGDVNQAAIAEFIQRSNHLSQRLMSVLEITNPEIIEALAECAMHATVMLRQLGFTDV